MTDPTPRAATPTPSRPQPGVAVPASSFDFLEGRFRAAARSRLFNVVTASVLVVLVMFAGARTVEALLAKADAQSEAQRQATALADVRAQVQAASTAGQATAGQVAEHVDARAAQAATAAQMQLPYASFVASIFTLPDATVSSAVFTAEKDGKQLVTVKGSAPTPQSAASATSRLSSDPTFSFLKPTTQPLVSCTDTATADACSWEWAGELLVPTTSPRSSSLQEQFAVTPLAKPAAPPALSVEGK